MEFVTQAEEITTFLLIPLLSIGIFLIISMIEILEKHNELLFITKNHKYNKHDFIMPGLIAVFVFILFYGSFWFLEDWFNSLPSYIRDCDLGSICHNKELEQAQARKDFLKLITKWLNFK